MNNESPYIMQIISYVSKDTIIDIKILKIDSCNTYVNIANMVSILTFDKSAIINKIITEYNNIFYKILVDKSKLFINNLCEEDSTFKYNYKSYFISEELAMLFVSYELFKKKVLSSKKLTKLNDYLVLLEELKFLSHIEKEEYKELKSKLNSFITAYTL